MAVRNWWIEADIDGRKTRLSGGPRAKDGGLDLVIKQRSGGAIVAPVEIRGRAKTTDDGRTVLELTIGLDDWSRIAGRIEPIWSNIGADARELVGLRITTDR